MSLRFPYRRVPVHHTVASLDGVQYRPRPIVTVTLVGPRGNKAIDVLVDSGSDDSVFPEQLAMPLGLDLTNAPRHVMTRLSHARGTIRYAQIRILLTDGSEFRNWPAWIAFTSAPLVYPTLGFAGALQFFLAKLDGPGEVLEFEIGSSYPGT